MRECRYQGNCEHENHNPCYPVDDVVCKGYQPMPDVSALLKLASRMEADANEAIYFEMTMEPFDVAEYAGKIREAVGA